MAISADDRVALETLEARLRTILPPEYQEAFEDVQPVSMGSAGLKYGFDGKVLWNEIWGSFCDLAMAGGPPHKGKLLEPAPRHEIDAQPYRHDEVVQEICRGVSMVTRLATRPSPVSGWVRVTCLSDTMAGWLLRAIVMENVAVRAEGQALDLPAGPGYRIEKEIKNVVTVIAKTCHYWLGHVPRVQQRDIAEVFAALAEESPLLQPAQSTDGVRAKSLGPVFARTAGTIERETGLPPSRHRYAGWLGVECPSVPAAVWMMRMMVAANILSRREETVLFVPIDPANDPDGDIVAGAVARVHRLAAAKDLL